MNNQRHIGPVRVIGIDPGSRTTGYAIVARDDLGFHLEDFGIIRLPKEPLPVRLSIIFNELSAIIRRHPLHLCAIETSFYGKNAQSAMKLGHARAAAILAATEESVDIQEYSPREVKKSTAGIGSASKQRIRSTVIRLFPSSELSASAIPLDASDAIAVALTGIHHISSHSVPLPDRQKKSGSWKSFIEANPHRVRCGSGSRG